MKLRCGAGDQLMRPCRYRLAPQLRQWRVVIGAEEKPLALLVLLQKLVGQLVIVFAGSVRLSIRQLLPCSHNFAQVDATRRLYSMLSALDADFPVSCVEYSSLQSHKERSHALELFRQREATVLVASDAATRGLDVEVRLLCREWLRPSWRAYALAHRVSMS